MSSSSFLFRRNFFEDVVQKTNVVFGGGGGGGSGAMGRFFSSTTRSSSSSLSTLRRPFVTFNATDGRGTFEKKELTRHLATNQHLRYTNPLTTSTRSSTLTTAGTTVTYFRRSFATIGDSDEDNNEKDIATIIMSLPTQLLRSDDQSTFDPVTHQRNNVPYELDTGKPIVNSHNDNGDGGGGGGDNNATSLSIQNYTLHPDDNNLVMIDWNDNITTTHELLQLQKYYQQRTSSSSIVDDDRVFWTDLTESQVRQSSELSLSYKTLIYGTNKNDDSSFGMKIALKALYTHGFVLITDTPTDSTGSIAALGAALSGGSVKRNSANSILVHYRDNMDAKNNNDTASMMTTVLPDATDGPLRTLYGNVWSTSSSAQAEGTSVADSAYTNDGLPLHTDMTYLRDPPGLQIFTMVQPAVNGGESVFGDGFAVAQHLRDTDPQSFNVLSTTIRRYHSRDELTGWNLQASGPVIGVRSTDGRLESIRHNDLDRLPDIPPSSIDNDDPQGIDDFYNRLDRAHVAWDTCLAQDKFRLVMKLQPGDTMVVANQRVFHGRCSFTSNSSTPPRSVMGCYVAQDDLLSRMRMEGYDV